MCRYVKKRENRRFLRCFRGWIWDIFKKSRQKRFYFLRKYCTIEGYNGVVRCFIKHRCYEGGIKAK